MKSIKYTTLHGLNLGLGGLTTDIDWFIDTIEKTHKSEYMKIFLSPKISRRKFKLIHQNEEYTDIIVTDAYGRKTFLEIKENKNDI